MGSIKNSLLWRFFSSVKHIVREIKYERYGEQLAGFFQTSDYFKSKAQRVYVVTTPEYGNLGDHAIAIAEIEILKSIYPDAEVIDVPDHDFWKYYLGLKYRLKKRDVICMIGGGNMGNLYPETEYIRRKLISGIKKNKIILFPQTIDFTDDSYGQRMRSKMIRLYNKNTRLWLCAREKKSYDIMKEMFPQCHVKLCPDVVLSLQYDKRVAMDNKKVIVCFRNDKEKALSETVVAKLKKRIKKDGYSIVECDTQKSYQIGSQNREEEVGKVLEEFSSARFVVTDRLHGMIFSQICGVPCLAFDNMNKKISGVSEWITRGICMCNISDKWEEAYERIEMMGHFNPDSGYYRKYFYELFNEVDTYNEIGG